jgi:hypothetical protein
MDIELDPLAGSNGGKVLSCCSLLALMIQKVSRKGLHAIY